jgi:poly-gamma-glutamate capsule biosynthesis protein CapA/YwtB (metallophosphatase superfamily)
VKERGAAVFGDAQEIITRADLSFVNLECPLTARTSGIVKAGPSIKADPLCAQALSIFELVGLANNHVLDYGAGGIEDTINACRTAGVKTVGAGANLDDAQAPVIVQCKGVRVAVIALAEHEFNVASRGDAGAAPIDPVDNYRQIEIARAASDVVLVTLHAGNEGFAYPRPGLRKLCRHYIDLGVAAVICHHPHVPGAYEYYKGHPIIYSLGNVIMDPRVKRSDEWHYGYMVRLGIEVESKKVMDLELIPYFQDVDVGGVRLLHGKEKSELLARIERYRKVVEDDDSFSKEWEAYVESLLA